MFSSKIAVLSLALVYATTSNTNVNANTTNKANIRRSSDYDINAYFTYNPYTANQTLTSVACSDGANGLITRWNYTTLAPMYPYVSSVSNVVWNSANCGVCYKLVNTDDNTTTIYVTAIDGGVSEVDGDVHFDLSDDAFKLLFGSDDAGHKTSHYEEADDYSLCQGNLGPNYK
eukprot:Pgem_evm3s11094